MKPNSKQESVIQNSEGTFVVRVNAPPAEGRANRRLIELLAQYFGTSKSKIELVSGSKSKLKTFKVKC